MRKILLLFAAMCCTVMANAETYGLSVGGVQVTSDNASDILGNGTASYNAWSNTLTLNNADIRMNGKGAIVAAGNLYIDVVGTNNYIAVNNLGEHAGAAIQTGGNMFIQAPFYATEFSNLQIVCGAAPALYAVSGNIWLSSIVNIDIKGGTGANGCIKTLNGDLNIVGAGLSMLPAWIRDNNIKLFAECGEITTPTDAIIADGKIVRQGSSSEYSNQQQVVISSLYRKLIVGAAPKSSDNTVTIESLSLGDCTFKGQKTVFVCRGEELKFTATAAEGYEFVGWFDKENNALSTNNPMTLIMTESTDLVYGKFEQQEDPGDTRTVITHVEVNNWDPSFFYDGLEWTGAVENQLIQMLQVPTNAVYYVREVYCRDMSKNQLLDIYSNRVVSSGTYRCEISLRIGGDNGLLYRFPGLDDEVNLTGTINGQTCEVELGSVTDEYSFVYINTPEFVINAEGVESILTSEVSVQKVIRDGQLLIEKNGKTYNALGAEIQ